MWRTVLAGGFDSIVEQPNTFVQVFEVLIRQGALLLEDDTVEIPVVDYSQRFATIPVPAQRTPPALTRRCSMVSP
jgi:hypothetical protein